jgi:glycerol-3-phosphate dehydrogenase
VTNQSDQRYRVVILGGGIHGVGVAHDLASRGWTDILLLEKATIGAGTSSKSTKLIHGGLRYLRHPRDFALVAEGLSERSLLATIAPDLVKPLSFIFPVMRKGGMPRPVIKAGLWLYDLLSHGRSFGRHRWLDADAAFEQAPILDKSVFKGFYQFFDGQTDDLALTRRVAESAKMLGATILEHAKAVKITQADAGCLVEYLTAEGPRTASARHVVNALGPWAHEIFDASAMTPRVEGINNQGIHIIVRDLGLKSGLFLQSPEDDRIFFVLPWLGYTLIGTTEDVFAGNPDECQATEAQVQYLLERCNRFLSVKLAAEDVISSFSGMRWLARDSKSGLSTMSRSHLVTVHRQGQGSILTIYGGKLTAYRALAEEVGDMVLRDFGDATKTRTRDPLVWAAPSELPKEMAMPTRFSVI